MTDLYWLWAFMHSFFTTVVITCAHPTNWDNCFPVHEWMVPWIHDVVHMHENGAYHAEKCTLQESNGLGRLDDRGANP
jgi:hypothetical protein